jgi:hypothetical protein
MSSIKKNDHIRLTNLIALVKERDQMNEENSPLVTNIPIELEKQLVEVQNVRKLLVILEEFIEHT